MAGNNGYVCEEGECPDMSYIVIDVTAYMKILNTLYSGMLKYRNLKNKGSLYREFNEYSEYLLTRVKLSYTIYDN